jgi:hypothetical protein
MTLKIDTSELEDLVVLSLSGRIEAWHLGELARIVELRESPRDVTLDLQQLRLADRASVKFLANCEAKGIKLKNCPTYIREWMEREKTEELTNS